jgi:GT2 family glycosyltransferase
MPAVSVIITTYNRGPILTDAIQSILAQDYRDFELLVVDDGSTDDTPERIHPFRNHLLFIQHSRNLGISAARNTGIIHSSGNFICFLDSDDLWKKRKLSAQMTFLRANPAYQICYTGEVWLRNGTWLNQKLKHQKFSGCIFEKLLPLCLISPSSVMVARKVLDRTGYFDESFPACEDYDLWLRIGWRFPIGYLEDRLIIKRGGHQDQLSQKFAGLDKLRIKALMKVLAQGALTCSQREAAGEELKRKCLVYARGCLNHHKDKEAAFFLSISRNIEALPGAELAEPDTNCGIDRGETPLEASNKAPLEAPNKAPVAASIDIARFDTLLKSDYFFEQTIRYGF